MHPGFGAGCGCGKTRSRDTGAPGRHVRRTMRSHPRRGGPSAALRARHAAREAALVSLFVTTLSCAAFDLQGHRGARGLAPENTLAGFATALRVGVTTLELDVGMSRDGVLMVTHDRRLNPDLVRGPDGRWVDPPPESVRALDREQLQRHDVGRFRPGSDDAQRFASQRPADGARIPTLNEVFAQVQRWGASGVRFNIEIKTDPRDPDSTASPEAFVAALLDGVERHDLAGRVSVQSFDWRTLKLVQARAPRIPTVALTVRQRGLDNVADPAWTAGLKLGDHGGSVPRLVRASGATTWSPHHADLTAGQIAEAQALGLKVVPWTVNDPAGIARLIDAGVDGLISDYPDRVRDELARRGLPLPAPVDVPGP
jgi:glycerophosphoryl diester phosphodiesterase